MVTYITLVGFMILLPIAYWGILQWYKPNFKEEKNQSRIILKTVPEIIVLIASETALLRIWYILEKPDIQNMKFVLLYAILVGMTVLCITDLWEKVVPNRILLFMVLIYIIILGFQGIRDMNVLIKQFPTILLGLLFCVLTFGVGYLISHGGMGAGDVKLSILMGLYLTGDYVVAVVVYGCLISAVYSICQLIRKKVSRNDELPFVPFLYAGLIIKYFVG